eukprot:9307930-Karenia_brevis.AAC.1
MIPYVATEIFTRIKGRACSPFSSGQRKKVSATISVLQRPPVPFLESQPESETQEQKKKKGKRP